MIMEKYRRPYRIKRLQPSHHFLLRQRRRQPKSILKSRFFWLTVLFLIIAGTFIYFLIFSSFFQIKEIKISGNEKVSTEEIKNLIEEKIDQRILFPSSKSIFLVDFDLIKNTLLEKFPQIAKINLKRKFPDVLTAEIKEREAIGIFNQPENYFLIDKEGVIFELAVLESEEYFEIKKLNLTTELKLGDRAVEKEIISQILDIEKKLREIGIKIEEFTTFSEERLNAKTIEGWQIYFDSKGDLDWQIMELRLVLEKEIPLEKRNNLEYIDLRFSKVYYKYKTR